jgi:transcription initiation factor TFIIF subunit beta
MPSSDSDNRVTADSYGNLQGSEPSGKECWMLRVPPKLAQAFENSSEGTVLGELVFKKGGGKGSKIKPSLEVHVDSNIASDQDQTLPLKYSLQAMTKKLPTLHPFTRNPNGSVKIHGIVSRTANLQVQQDANYRALCKNRILASTVHNSRYVKPVESNQVVQQTSRGAQHPTRQGGFGDAVHQFGKRMIEAQQNQSLNLNRPNKKARFTADTPLKSVIFQLYEDSPFWTTKDLRAASGGRPEGEIKKVLQEIATYHRSGEHKNTWELKKEFQAQPTKQDPGQDGGSGDAAGATGGA